MPTLTRTEKIVIPILVTPETRRQLKIHAAERDTSVCALLNKAIVEILKDGREQPAREPIAA
jgi:hypothetical protein